LCVCFVCLRLSLSVCMQHTDKCVLKRDRERERETVMIITISISIKEKKDKKKKRGLLG